jgi:hypothetical protein
MRMLDWNERGATNAPGALAGPRVKENSVSPPIRDQANVDAATTEIQANVQHMKRASFRLVLDDKPELATEGGPRSSHSEARGC